MKYLNLLISIIVLLAIAGPASLSAAGARSIPVAVSDPVYLAAASINNSAPASQAATPLYYGDANENGEIDMGDVVVVERMILGLQSFTIGSDTNIDGDTNMGDVTAIELIILGLKPRVLISDVGPNIRTVTLTDSDLPSPPISGMTFHFVSPAAADTAPGKLRASYGIMSWSIWFGITDGQLWVFNLPKKENMPESLQSFYDYLGIDEFTVYTEEDGKYWFTSLPPWLNISQHDPDVVTMPTLVSVASASGLATIRYTITP
jgi:hypothetical protein